jgi:hypothetical protein
MKLTPNTPQKDSTLEDEGLFDDAIEERRMEADEFYYSLTQGYVSDDLRAIMRQALAGMLWTKQHYKFIASEWLKGDPAQPPPPPSRKFLRGNKVCFSKPFVTMRSTSTDVFYVQDWMHLYASDILSMPDKYAVATTVRSVVNDFADGNILILQHGTALSTAFPLPWLILRSPRSSLTCSLANGT